VFGALKLKFCYCFRNISPLSDRNQISVRGLYEQQSKLISKIEGVLERLKTSSFKEKLAIPHTLSVSFALNKILICDDNPGNYT